MTGRRLSSGSRSGFGRVARPVELADVLEVVLGVVGLNDLAPLLFEVYVISRSGIGAHRSGWTGPVG
ncbi:hypothetical protein GCM10025862_15580 [Arsenicicoccus piscis]|uniref:Uncharacterized protein n=1 Tax=Arsenicicoccus piscis TaxID=673954 RepID=A0ABQ6HN26_9MICO|nr:hypothetical protein GCM10025862_15580 [Arsenicicoccus piscis]